MDVKIVLVILFLLEIKSSEGFRNTSKSIRLNRVTEDNFKILVRIDVEQFLICCCKVL